MLQMYHTVVKHKLNDNFVLWSLMNFPYDAVTVLMVMTRVLIHVIAITCISYNMGKSDLPDMYARS